MWNAVNHRWYHLWMGVINLQHSKCLLSTLPLESHFRKASIPGWQLFFLSDWNIIILPGARVSFGKIRIVLLAVVFHGAFIRLLLPTVVHGHPFARIQVSVYCAPPSLRFVMFRVHEISLKSTGPLPPLPLVLELLFHVFLTISLQHLCPEACTRHPLTHRGIKPLGWPLGRSLQGCHDLSGTEEFPLYQDPFL